jgi:hypothetical protein
MTSYAKLFLAAALVLVSAATASAQQAPAGDKNDQFVITGCVTPSADFRSAPAQSMFVWSRGDVYLASPSTRVKPSETARPIGTTGTPGPVFYWLDDENDFAKYAGQHVEIVGELSDELDDAEIEIESEGDFTEIEFEVGGREASARIPTSWLGPSTRGRDLKVDVAVRTVDVENVTVMGPCTTR